MAGGILDPKSIQDRLEKLVNQQVDQQVEGKTPPASPAAPKDPFEGLQNPAATPTPSAAAAPSAPAAEGTTSPRGQVIYVDDLSTVPDGEIAVWGANMDNYLKGTNNPKAGQAYSAFGRKGWIGVPTKRSPSVFLSDADLQDPEFSQLMDGQLRAIEAALANGQDVYFPSNGIGTGRANLQAAAPTVFDKLNNRLSKIGITNDAQGAESPLAAQTVVGTPPPGETTPSVAQIGLPEASSAPVEGPQTQTTATTPTDQPDPFSGITDPTLVAGNVPPEDIASEPIYELPKTGGRRIGVIGTAGRKEKAVRLTKSDFEAMVAYLAKAVQPNDTLVSGGAAYADHSAVRAYLDGKVAGLVLHLPAQIVTDDKGRLKFEDAGYGTAGAAANYYHRLFAEKLGLDPDGTIREIQEAIDKGATVTYADGTAPAAGKDSSFLQRNSLIAKDSDYGVIAFDFDVEGRDRPADGGTGDTWRKHSRMHSGGKRRLVDIRKMNPDPTEGDRINGYNQRQVSIAEKRESVKRLAQTVRASDLTADEKIDLLGKLTGTGKSQLPSDRDVDSVLRSLEKVRAKSVFDASGRAYLPIQKLVSAAILVGLADTGNMPIEFEDMLSRGEIPNVTQELLNPVDPDAALIFLRTRALQHSIERGTGDKARKADRILHQALMALGIPEESLQPLTPYRPNFTTTNDDPARVESVERSNNAELAKRIDRIKALSAKLGALMSHPEVAKPIYTITELLRGVEADIAAEPKTLQISRLRTDPLDKIPYLRAAEQVDPVWDYINSKEYLMQRVEPSTDPYVTHLAMIESRSLPPETRGEGVYAYDEAQLKETHGSIFSGKTDWRRYALDLGGEIDPYHMDLDEFGLVTDKFDGFKNKYADYAMPTHTYGVSGPQGGVSASSPVNRSRATIGMHVSTDASAGIGWGNRAVDLEVHVVRAIKKLLADTPGTDIMPDTADELSIVRSAFMPYTRDAQVVTAAAKNVTTSLNATTGKIFIVDTDGIDLGDPKVMEDPSGAYINVDGEKFYLGKGLYAFKESDPRGDRLAEELSRFTGESPRSRRSAAFSIGDTDIPYPASVPNRIADQAGLDFTPAKSFSITVDPVVHQTFQHGPIGSPLVRADGRPFKGTYVVVPMADGESEFADTKVPSHAYDDSNKHLIEFDEGMRFGITTPVPQGVLVDGIDLERDYLGDEVYDRMRGEMPMQLAGEASKAANRQQMLESGERIQGEIAPTGRALEYEAAASGETESHFGQSYAFDELDSTEAEAAAHPLRRLMSRMQARKRERMAQLGVVEGIARPASITPEFDVSTFLNAEALSPENAAIAKQIIFDYMWILRLRVRDASQSTPRPKVKGQPDEKSSFLLHREVAFRRRSILQSLGFDDIIDLHNAASKGPAVLNAVVSEVMEATGDDPKATEEVLSEIYREYPADDPRKLSSTRDGRFSYNAFPPRNDLEKHSTTLADQIRRAMATERGADAGRAMSLEALLNQQEAAISAGESTDTNLQGAAEPDQLTKDVLELRALDPNSQEFEQKLKDLQAKVEVPAASEPLRYTTKSGIKLIAAYPESEDILKDIIARDEAGRLTDEVLSNAMANIQRVNKEAAKARKKTTTVDQSTVAIRDAELARFLQTADQATLRNVVMRAWAKYAEHMAVDGDYDSFVNVIRNGLKKKDQLPKALNFVMDKLGAVKLPDMWFEKDGALTFPVPKVKNPKYSSSARRVNALDGVLTASEMREFVNAAEASGTLKKSAAARLRGVIRFAEQHNTVMVNKGMHERQVAFHILSEGGGPGRVLLTTSPTFASQKTAPTPYRSTESGPGDYSTLEDSSGRLQLFSAAELQKIITAIGADSALRVVPLKADPNGILSQVEGIATPAEIATASPYAVEFADGTKIEDLVRLFDKDTLNLRAGRTEKEAIVYRLLDASIRARFFSLMKGVLDSAGVTEEVITAEDLDNNPFVLRETQPTEAEVYKRILAGQTEEEARKPKQEYVVKDSVESMQSYEGPFSRVKYGGSGTLSERPYKSTFMSPALRDFRDILKTGASTMTQEDADTLAEAIDTTIEYKKQQSAFRETGKTSWRPGVKAGIIGGAGVGTLAAFLQYGADEKAKEAAMASLPSQVAFEALGAIPKVGGPVAAATGLGLTYATGGDMLRALVGIGGSIAGGALGTGLGLFTGPGAFAAGLAGSTAGYMAADSIYSAVTGKSNTSPLPQNVASSNPVQSARLEIPTKREVQQTAPLPAVNRDIAKLEEMG